MTADRDPRDQQLLASSARYWLRRQGREMNDEVLEQALLGQGVINPEESVLRFDDAEGFAVLVTLETGEWFSVDARTGDVQTND